MQAIDVDRGVTMRQTVVFDKNNPSKFLPDPRYGGVTVYMYKDEPGIYYDAHGNKVPEGVAKIAGFDTGKLAKLRHKREAMAQFEAKLRKQLELENQDAQVVIAEAGDWQVIEMPLDRAKIVDKTTGALVTAVPMAKGEALLFLATLTETAEEGKIQSDANSKKGSINGGSSA